MIRRTVVALVIATVFALALSGCVYAPPSVPPAAGPPGPENGTDWPVTGNGPSEDATQAYKENPNKAVEDVDLGTETVPEKEPGEEAEK